MALIVLPLLRKINGSTSQQWRDRNVDQRYWLAKLIIAVYFTLQSK